MATLPTRNWYPRSPRSPITTQRWPRWAELSFGRPGSGDASGGRQRKRQPVDPRAISGTSGCADGESPLATETSVAVGHQEVGPPRVNCAAVVAVERVVQA